MKLSLRQRFRNWLMDDNEPKLAEDCVVSERDTPDSERSIRFTVYFATGGRVVETRYYDRQKDRNIMGLYIVTNDQNFGEQIDKILTQEALKVL